MLMKRALGGALGRRNRGFRGRSFQRACTLVLGRRAASRSKKTLPTFGAHRGGCEMSAIAGSVAVGLARPHLQQTKSPVAFINATHMPARSRSVPGALRRDPQGDFSYDL